MSYVCQMVNLAWLPMLLLYGSLLRVKDCKQAHWELGHV